MRKKRNRRESGKRRKKIRGAKRKLSGKAAQKFSPDFRMMENPFATLTDWEREQVRQELAEASAITYRQSVDKIVAIFKKHHPRALLPVVAFYGLSTGVGEKGIATKDSERTFHQHHLEVCQALALQIPPNELGGDPFRPTVVQELFDSVTDLTRAEHYRRLKEHHDSVPDDEKAIAFIQGWIRANTRNVRNWGYFSQVLTVAREMYSQFDDVLLAAHGFTATNIIDLFQVMVAGVETRLSSHFQSMRVARRTKDKATMVHQYFEAVGLPPNEATRFLEHANVKSLSRSQLFFMLVAHADLELYRNYEFSPDYLSAQLEISRETVRALLEAFAYEWGALEGYDTERIYLSNPIWLRPIIKSADDNFLCVMPQLFFSFLMPAMERLIECIGKDALNDRRAEYLESKVSEIICRRFPESNTVARMKWKAGDDEYETDLITFIDSQVLIVEAKSGRITEPALRGAPERLRRHFREVLLAPNIQSRRLKEKLEDLIANPHKDDALREALPVDLRRVHRVTRLSVSLEDFGSLQSNLSQFKSTGWLPDDFQPCPTMNLADFETLFDVLEHPVHIIHYLQRREEIEGTWEYIGDELDLMGLYIRTLFNMGSLEKQESVILTGLSEPLDAYYNSRDAGVLLPKPVPRISALFASILTQLERRATFRWSEIGALLNRVPPDDQYELTRLIRSLKDRRGKIVSDPESDNILIYTPTEPYDCALAYFVYTNATVNRRNEFIDTAATAALKGKHIRQCLVIGKNLDAYDSAYDFIGLANPADEAKEPGAQ